MIQMGLFLLVGVARSCFNAHKFSSTSAISLRNMHRGQPTIPRVPGVREATRNRIVNEMLTAVREPFKILIVDDVAMRVLGSCMRMHDVMEFDVTLVEPIGNKRQPVKSSPALYFVAPTQANVNAIINDWATGTPYLACHVFFVSEAPDSVISALATSRAKDSIKTLKDLLVDYSALEPLVFSCEQKLDVAKYFGAMATPSAIETAARHLRNVLETAGAKPYIRHQNTPLSTAVAAKVDQMIDTSQGHDGDVVIIVDRSIDVVAPLVHEHSYQAMVEDLFPLENGILSVPGRNRGDPPKRIPIDQEDAMWCELRHLHIGQAISECSAKLNQLKKDHPQLASFDANRDTMSMRDIGDAVRSLPEFQQKQARIAVHMELTSKLMSLYKGERIDAMASTEQMIASGVTDRNAAASQKDMLKGVMDMLKEHIAPEAKARLIALFCAVNGTSKLDELLKAGNLTASQASVAEALKNFDPWNAEKSKRKRVAAKWDYDSARFEPFLKTMMVEQCHGTLSTEHFPWYGSAPSGPHASPGAAQPAQASAFGGAGAKKPGLASKFSSKFGGGGSSGKSASDSKMDFAIDLGHGQVAPVSSQFRIWVYVVGGITQSECRSAYEVLKSEHRVVIAGGTSLCKTFFNDVALLGSAF